MGHCHKAKATAQKSAGGFFIALLAWGAAPPDPTYFKSAKITRRRQPLSRATFWPSLIAFS